MSSSLALRASYSARSLASCCSALRFASRSSRKWERIPGRAVHIIPQRAMPARVKRYTNSIFILVFLTGFSVIVTCKRAGENRLWNKEERASGFYER